MNKLAIRPVEQADIQNLSLAPREPDWSWLPEEAPLAMPRQALDAAVAARDVTPATSPRTVRMRRLTLLAGTLALAGLSAMTDELEELKQAARMNRVPAVWLAKSYPSLKPLSSYVKARPTAVLAVVTVLAAHCAAALRRRLVPCARRRRVAGAAAS